jgi:hypothetical protein
VNDDHITYAQLSRDETGPEDGEATPDSRQDISDPATGLSRLLSERRGTCILRPGDPMTRPDTRAARLRRQDRRCQRPVTIWLNASAVGNPSWTARSSPRCASSRASSRALLISSGPGYVLCFPPSPWTRRLRTL